MLPQRWRRRSSERRKKLVFLSYAAPGLESQISGLWSPVSGPTTTSMQSRLTTINLHSLLKAPKSVKVSLRARFSGESRILPKSKPAARMLHSIKGRSVAENHGNISDIRIQNSNPEHI